MPSALYFTPRRLVPCRVYYYVYPLTVTQSFFLSCEYIFEGISDYKRFFHFANDSSIYNIFYVENILISPGNDLLSLQTLVKHDKDFFLYHCCYLNWDFLLLMPLCEERIQLEAIEIKFLFPQSLPCFLRSCIFEKANYHFLQEPLTYHK